MRLVYYIVPDICVFCILTPIYKCDIIFHGGKDTSLIKWNGVLNITASKAQQKAVSKYMKENYDEVKLRMEKGKKDKIKSHADAAGESMNGFINRAIDETMERDNKE